MSCSWLPFTRGARTVAARSFSLSSTHIPGQRDAPREYAQQAQAASGSATGGRTHYSGSAEGSVMRVLWKAVMRAPPPSPTMTAVAIAVWTP